MYSTSLSGFILKVVSLIHLIEPNTLFQCWKQKQSFVLSKSNSLEIHHQPMVPKYALVDFLAGIWIIPKWAVYHVLNLGLIFNFLFLSSVAMRDLTNAQQQSNGSVLDFLNVETSSDMHLRILVQLSSKNQFSDHRTTFVKIFSENNSWQCWG